MGQCHLVRFRCLAAALLLHDLHGQLQLVADDGGQAALLFVQLGDLLAVHIHSDLIGCLHRLAALVHCAVVEIDGVAASDAQHQHGDEHQHQNEGDTDEPRTFRRFHAVLPSSSAFCSMASC